MTDTYTRRKSVCMLGEKEECRRVVVELVNRESRAKDVTLSQRFACRPKI